MPIKMLFWKTPYYPEGSLSLEPQFQERKEEVLNAVAPMNSEEKKTVLAYMAASSPYQRYRGWASCRVCGAMLGSADMETPDGKFLHPSGWEHYILEHGVRPEEPFLIGAKEWFHEQAEKEKGLP